MQSTRLRLLFKDKEAILRESQKSEGLKRCWVLLKPQQHKTIADLTAYILHAFQLHPTCPHGLTLYMDGFVLPSFESTEILKDKDVISVRKKVITSSFEGNNGTNLLAEMEALQKQPVQTGVLLLASEEFEKETGGYQSDEPEDESEEENKEEETTNASEEEDEEDQLEDTLHNSLPGNATSKKRKALEKLQGSKKKKQCSEVQGSIQNSVPAKQIENSHQDGALARKESNHKQDKVSKLKKKNNSDNTELGVGDLAASPKMKSSDQTQKNGEEIKEASGGIPKIISRSARRKKAKRQWIREMAKIQKKDNISKSKELQNWKQKPARAEAKKYNNWKQKPAKPDGKEDEGQPKGLLYWKQWSGKDTSNDKRKHHEANNGSVSVQSNQTKDLEDEVVPVVVRPGHIRFEPLEKDQVVIQNQVSVEPFQWNGITSKRKGQKWGTEKYSFSRRNEYKDINRELSEALSIPKELHLNGAIDFDKLPPLSDLPKAGDVIGYRLLELSSTWTPELSPFRVGYVSWCNSKSGKLILMPVPGYPVISKNSDEEPNPQPDNSLYKEDGSLEIEFTTLIDVRVVKDGNEGPAAGVTGVANGGPAGTENAILSVPPANNDKATDVSSPRSGEANREKQPNATGSGTGEANLGKQTNATGSENGGNIWEQLSEALNAKKEQLSQENSWDKASSSTGSRSYRALKGSALGPTMALLRSENKL